jgi:hemoglobin
MDRRTVAKGAGAVAGAAALGLFPASAEAGRAPQSTSAQPSLYDPLGGYFAIAAVVNRFSDEILNNPILNKNPALKEWKQTQAKRGCQVSSSVARCGSRPRPADGLCTPACR